MERYDNQRKMEWQLQLLQSLHLGKWVCFCVSGRLEEDGAELECDAMKQKAHGSFSWLFLNITIRHVSDGLLGRSIWANMIPRTRVHTHQDTHTHWVCKWPMLRSSVLWGLLKWVIMCKWSCNDVLLFANVPIKCSWLQQSRIPKDTIMDTRSLRRSSGAEW